VQVELRGIRNEGRKLIHERISQSDGTDANHQSVILNARCKLAAIVNLLDNAPLLLSEQSASRQCRRDLWSEHWSDPMVVTGTHDFSLVVLSVLVASFASYTALDLGGRLGAAHGRARWTWLITAAISMGGGIWAMHFIGMLAFVMPIPVSYDIDLTALSLVVAIVVTAIGFHIISRSRESPLQLVLSGVVMGVGIVAMHYTGMEAMQGHAGVTYDPLYVVLSVFIAIGASTAALWLAFRTTDLRQKLFAAVVMGLAISGMHYTAMHAANFTAYVPAHELPTGASLDQTRLALALAGIAFVILIFALIASLLDRRAATALNREVLFRLTLDTIPIMVWQTRPDGFAEYMNRRVLDYTGLSLPQVSGGFWQAAVHPDDLPSLTEKWREIVTAGEPAEMEARLRRSDGEYRRFLVRAEPLRDAEGKIVKWYGVNVDIEDRKRAEEALRRSEAYLAEAQRLSLTGSFGWRIESGEIIWSEETYRIFEFDPALKPTVALVLQRTHPDDRVLVVQATERASQHGFPIDLAHRLLLPDGSVKHVKVLAHATETRAGEREYIGAITDITAAKSAEQALHRAQAELAHAARVATLGELAASIVHEVNQPITAIVNNGNASLNWLRAQSPDLEEVRTSVQSMISDGHRAGEVIRRLRLLAKKGDPQKVALKINDVIDDVLLLVDREMLSHQVAVRTKLAEDVPAVFGDRVQLQQVIINLIMNGIDAMVPVVDRPRELVIRSEHQEKQVLVAIEDSGIGIDPTHMDRLFDAFFTTKSDGMGMGLPICRSIINAHGGQLWVAQNVAAGTTFHFSLPLQHPVQNDDRAVQREADCVRH
jgi:PAS domain S-box-containing protein